jgi:hypothetical protein
LRCKARRRPKDDTTNATIRKGAEDFGHFTPDEVSIVLSRTIAFRLASLQVLDLEEGPEATYWQGVVQGVTYVERIIRSRQTEIEEAKEKENE